MFILFAEDETDLAELTIDFLEAEGIDCDYAFDGVNALNLIEKNVYDVIVLDVTMPRLDGFSVCKKLKALGLATPVIFLTARDNLADKLSGFELGADDYLTKPFELEELAARIKVLAKRPKTSKEVAKFTLNSLTINYQQRSVTRGERSIALAPSQWQLLALLAKNSPNIVDRMSIENEIWPDSEPSKDMLKTLIFRLRSLIDNEGDLTLIHTIRGAGVALREFNHG